AVDLQVLVALELLDRRALAAALLGRDGLAKGTGLVAEVVQARRPAAHRVDGIELADADGKIDLEPRGADRPEAGDGGLLGGVVPARRLVDGGHAAIESTRGLRLFAGRAGRAAVVLAAGRDERERDLAAVTPGGVSGRGGRIRRRRGASST